MKQQLPGKFQKCTFCTREALMYLGGIAHCGRPHYAKAKKPSRKKVDAHA